MSELDQILEERSAEMEEIVGIIPSWITRWGLTCLFIIAMMGLFVSFFIKYPETLQTTVIVQSENQPGKVTVKRDDANQIFNFLVKNGDMVKPGDTLLVHVDKNTGKEYSTVTPMTGKIYLSNGTDEKNTLDKIIWVVPKSTGSEIKIKFPVKGSGNVKTGQIVKFSLHGFPSHEYGFIEGKISSILPIEIDGMHQAYVKLPGKKIVTSEQKEIPVMPVMQGEGEILLSDKSIFYRIFGSVF